MEKVIDMTAKENLYQELVDSIRRREDFFKKFDGGWPGHYGRACSEYPNLAAELAAREWQITAPVEAARVSREVMAGVIEDGELLGIEELERIADRLRVSCLYLSSPVLSLVDPTKNKGMFQTIVLRWKLKEAEKYHLFGTHIKNARIALRSLERGRPVTYAAWRWMCQAMACEIDQQRNEHRSVRTERIVTRT